MKYTYRVALLMLALLLAGCFGRIHNPSEGRKIDPVKFGLDGTHPALLVFSAAWCKPCMAEIPALNRAQGELRGQVQIAGYVVEGAQKGVAAAPKDGDLFVSPGGERPAYRLMVDSAWALFDTFQAAAGRTLPTMVFVNRENTVVRIVQRSMEYETELLPLLRDLAADRTPVVPKPDPLPDPSEGKPANLTFAAWTAEAGNEPGSTMYQNVQAAWQRGLEDFSFLEEDMPFESARMTVFAYTDGHSKPVSALWVAKATGCKLTVYFKDDGSYDHSDGVCR